MLATTIKYNYIRFLLFNVYDEIISRYPESANVYALKQILIDNFSDYDDVFKKILIISKIEGLEKVSGYLLFVLKKLDMGLIKYDTFINNVLTDKQYLIREIINFFKLDKEISKVKEETHKENISIKVPDQFKSFEEVDKIDREFTEVSYSDKLELELIKDEDIISDEIVFTLPEEEKESEEPKTESIVEIEEKNELVEKTNVLNINEENINYTQPETKIEEEVKETEPMLFEGKVSEKVKIAEPADRVEEINTLYIEFEEKVTNRNEKIRNSFNYLLTEVYERENEDVINNIIKNAEEIESYSLQMTFELIPSLYSIIKDYFIYYQLGFFKQLDDNDLRIFVRFLDLVEALIKGEDLKNFENIITYIENFKNKISHLKDIQQETAKVKPEVTEGSFELQQPEVNYSEKESYLKIRENILYIKNVFDSIEKIESKYKIYEALTSLSKIFPQLKEIVEEAKQINQIDIARLAEATYIFIKFIQNYRINPFEKEVVEVLKYIIYNFKSLYLNKRIEDLDLFIKYLNNPTKIFENNDTK